MQDLPNRVLVRLRQTTAEFRTGHWGRLGMSAVTATLAFVGFLRFHRHCVLKSARER
ncbi:hypothetical protein [Allosalinactinospora lopnorensis]|uniref:hypothetical protein n=1 Tax=Allosalinactinospora lopnorensis TaxID=1352348 RepID=UPI0012E0FE60|nr:hypothetical protein [Allosalinactinospora lopnorensis]